MNFDQAPEFAKELKKFSKKWRRLPEDVLILQAVIATLFTNVSGLDAAHVRQMFFSGKKAAMLITLSESSEVVKIRLDSQDLDNSMLRVIYKQNGTDILLIELYAKNEKSRENQERITKYTT